MARKKHSSFGDLQQSLTHLRSNLKILAYIYIYHGECQLHVPLRLFSRNMSLQFAIKIGGTRIVGTVCDLNNSLKILFPFFIVKL